MNGPDRAVRVVVAVTTYRRPDDLDELLPLLLEQVRRLPGGYDGTVVVVDNDATGSARAVADKHAAPELRYVVERQPGIAAARNRALSEAADADLLAFIDDDERPSTAWLSNLLAVQQRTRSAGVTGPVITTYDVESVEPWVIAGGFLERRHRAGLSTGTAIDNAATNNLLLDLAVLRRLGLRFDVSFGLTGGEDTLFTRSLVAAGERITWCQEAPVTERIRSDRLNRRWMLGRALSYGTTDARVASALASGRRGRLLARAGAAFWGAVRLAVGPAIALAGRLGGSLARQAYGEQMLYRGCGLLLGAFGVRHQQYRRAGGDGRR